MTFPLVGLLRAGLLTLYLPASRLKKEPGDSDSDLSGLRDRRSCMSEAKSWISIPSYVHRAAGHGSKALLLGAFQLPGDWWQVGSLVTRETGRGASSSPALEAIIAVILQWLRHVWLSCDPVDCSPPGSSVHGIAQPRILEWVAISFSRGLNSDLLHCQVDSLLSQPPGKPQAIFVETF